MNAPIQVLYTSGQTTYSVSISNVDGTVYNTNTSLWETYNSGHWSKYAVALTEYTSSGYYRGTYPVATPTFLSTEVIYIQAGGSPTLGDQALTYYQSQGQNVAALANLWTPAQNMSAALGTEQIGTISGTPSSSTLLPTSLINTALDAYASRTILMTSGLLIQQAAYITAYDGEGNLTINGFPSGATPANGDAFVIV